MKYLISSGFIAWSFFLLHLSSVPSSSFVVADDTSENGNAEHIRNERPMRLQVIEQLPVRADPTRCNGEGMYYHPPTQKCVSCMEVCTPDVHSPSCRANCEGWCPDGWFFHTPSNKCLDCLPLCGGSPASEDDRKFCRLNCPGTNVNENACAMDQFYHGVLEKCINCSEICGEENDPTYCKNNCWAYVQHLHSTLTDSVLHKTNEAAQISAPTQPRGPNNDAEDRLIASPAYLGFIAVPVIVLVVILVYVKYHQKDSRIRYTRTNHGQIVARETEAPGDGMPIATEKESQVQQERRVTSPNRIEDVVTLAMCQHGSSAVAPSSRPGECAEVYRDVERSHNQLPYSTREPVSPYSELSITGSAPAPDYSVGDMCLSLRSEYEQYGDKTENGSRAWHSV